MKLHSALTVAPDTTNTSTEHQTKDRQYKNIQILQKTNYKKMRRRSRDERREVDALY